MIATRRSVTAREEDSQGCDVLLPASGLDELLRESDYVVQAVQWTPETDKMLGKAQFQVSTPQPSEHSHCDQSDALPAPSAL